MAAGGSHRPSSSSPGDARGEQLIKPETSAQMRGLLRYVVTNGTGKKADVPGYDVGGKTGSAEVTGRTADMSPTSC